MTVNEEEHSVGCKAHNDGEHVASQDGGISDDGANIRFEACTKDDKNNCAQEDVGCSNGSISNVDSNVVIGVSHMESSDKNCEAPNEFDQSEVSDKVDDDSNSTSDTDSCNDATTKVVTKRRARTKNKGEGDASESEAMLLSFLTELRKIAEDDIKCNIEGKPSLKKLQNLDSVCLKLINRKYQDFLVENGVLSIIKIWLEPLPDKSLPNIEIRRRIMGALYRMRVSVRHLKESGIGKIIKFYSMHALDSRDSMRIAKSIVQKWTNLVLSDGETF